MRVHGNDGYMKISMVGGQPQPQHLYSITGRKEMPSQIAIIVRETSDAWEVLALLQVETAPFPALSIPRITGTCHMS